MNKLEIAQLLTIASGFDRRQVDPVTVESWYLLAEIREADYEDSLAALLAHFASQSKEYFTAAHVVAATQVSSRQTKKLIAADVRSARARHLIPSDWPENEPVSDEIRNRLAQIRDQARQEARELEATVGLSELKEEVA